MPEEASMSSAAPETAVSAVVESSPISSTDAPSASSDSAVAESAAEKMLPQSEVNKLVTAVRHEEREKFLRKSTVLPAHQPNYAQSQVQEQPRVVDLSTAEGIKHVVSQTIQEEQNRAYQEQHAQEVQRAHAQLHSELLPKIDDAQKRYADFSTVVTPEMVREARSVNPMLPAILNFADNAGDVLYEVLKNPEKLAMINSLAGTPQAAMTYVKRLSQDIKARMAAKAAQPAIKPLDTISPSTVTPDGGEMSLADLKRKYRT